MDLSKFNIVSLIVHGKHTFQLHIGLDAVVRAANVATVFVEHADAFTNFPLKVIVGKKGQGGLGGNFQGKSGCPVRALNSYTG